jgi:cysteine desulfurase
MSSYLDYQSSKPVDPRVIEAMLPYFHEHFGNPSSLHGEGDEATKVLEDCRQTIAGFINAEPDEIIFTSGATESNTVALIGYASRNRDKGDHIIISEVEHISIHNIAKYLEKDGFKVSRLPVDQYGKINVQKLASRITPQTILISIGYASNEIGTIQPIAEVGALAREKRIAFHSDAVAAEGLIPLDVKKDQIDLLTISSNDIYGPKGIGVLYVRKGMRVNPVIIGGGQESKAVEIMRKEMTEEVKRLTGYRDTLIKDLLARIPKSHLNGHPIDRLANNAHVRFEAIEGESLILALRDEGVSAATGSACSSKTLEPSHTLISTGLLHEEAHGSLEFTLGRFNTEADVDRVIEVLPPIVERLRRLSPLYKAEEMAT